MNARIEEIQAEINSLMMTAAPTREMADKRYAAVRALQNEAYKLLNKKREDLVNNIMTEGYGY